MACPQNSAVVRWSKDPNVLLLLTQALFSRLTFQFLASSHVYGFSAYPLIDGGEDVDLTLDNAQDYIDRTMDFMFHSGIRKQVEALRGNAFATIFWQ